MRDYVPGDDLRRVVWAAVAKTGRMLVRESEQGITDRVSIAARHVRRGPQPGRPERHVRDGRARRRVDRDTPHQGRLLGHRSPPATDAWRPACAGRAPRIALLDDLARVNASNADLSGAGQVLLADARRGSHIVVITPHLDKDVTNRLRLVLERGSSVVVVKIVWDESDPQSLARAASLGCQVVQVPLNASIEAAFVHQVGGGIRR